MPKTVFATGTEDALSLRSLMADRLRPKTLGERGEDYAAKFLRKRGFKIVARRDLSRIGELDLVAVDDGTVVFVEVKTRRPTTKGQPTDAVDEQKQRQLTRAALTFLKSHGLLEERARFDVVAVTWPTDARTPTIEHIRNAFPAAGKAGQWFS